jgi:hypothetical protein
MPDHGSVLAPPVLMDDLRARIQEGIRDGSLPSVECLVAWYRPGRGQICDVCTGRILGTELALECDQPGGTTIWFHARCYDLWRSALGAVCRQPERGL